MNWLITPKPHGNNVKFDFKCSEMYKLAGSECVQDDWSLAMTEVQLFPN